MLWLTGEMPVFVLHISSFHLSNVKSEQKKKKNTILFMKKSITI